MGVHMVIDVVSDVRKIPFFNVSLFYNVPRILLSPPTNQEKINMIFITIPRKNVIVVPKLIFPHLDTHKYSINENF